MSRFDPPSTGILARLIRRAASAPETRLGPNILRLADRLQCLHDRRDLATCLSLRGIRLVSVDHSRRNLRLRECPRMAAQFLTRISSAPLVEA